MAKIEEITAMLINEIEDFKNSIEELKQESIKLDKKKFTIDTSQINMVLSDFNKKLNKNYDLQEEQVIEIQKKLSSTMVIPKWLIIVLITYTTALVFSISYNFYQKNNSIKIKEEALIEGKKSMETHILNFFKENPKALDSYKNWKNEK